MKKRCGWCNPENKKYRQYHDNEWGEPQYDDKYLLEMLILESFQAGLSWETILNKRESFRQAYDNFQIEKIIQYNREKQDRLKENKNIIRNKLKIKASINNAKIFRKISQQYNGFYNYLAQFNKGKTIYEHDKTTSPLSDEISQDLKKRGMTFVGSTITYSYLQAIGIINSHEPQCYKYKRRENQ